MSDLIENIAFEIKKGAKCNNCGGVIINGVCIYCNNVYDELVSLIEKLNSLLDDIFYNNQMSNKMNMIYSLKGMGIKKVDNLIEQTGYEKIVKSKYDEICNKINNDIELNSEDCENFKFLFENYEKEENKIYCCNYVIKSILLGKGQFSYDFFEKIIICFTEKVGEQLGLKCECEIGNLAQEYNGAKFYNYIRLNDNLISDFYYKKNPELLGTIFHEITHILQDKRQKYKSVVSINDLIQIKERIIKEKIEGFYDDNYAKITFENEARLNGDIYMIRYLKKLLNVQLDDEKEELERINMTIMENEDLLRNYRGTTVDVEDLFDEVIIDKPDYLEKYPSLKCQYKFNEDGQIIRKSSNELLDEVINDFTGLDKNSFKVILELYRYLIKKAKLQEKNKIY